MFTGRSHRRKRLLFHPPHRAPHGPSLCPPPGHTLHPTSGCRDRGLNRFPWKGLLMEAAILPPPGHQPDPQCIQAKIQRGSLSTRPAEAPPPASTPNPVCPVPLDHRRPRSWGICRAFSDPKQFPFSGGGAGTQSPFC